MSELLRLDALELARRVREKEITALEAVDAHIARIEQVNPKLNAVVWTCFERARREARAVDITLPLAGVPFTVKEMIALEGCRHAAGSWHRRDRLAVRDATVVARLRAAGAIALGVTNQPEMGLWVESDNVLYGRAKNPWDSSRSPGGSSGGEGAIIGAGGSPFGVASDAGGSIRLPSFYCGIAGHKPSGGVVPLTGHFPFIPDEEHPLHAPPPRQVVVGPMARSARDLLPLLRIMAGPDGVDPYVTSRAELGEASIKKVLVLADPRFRLATRTDPEIRHAVHAAAHVLRERGASIEEWSHPLLFDSMAIWRAFFTEGRDGLQASDIFAYGDQFNMPRELLRWVVGRPRHSFSSMMVVMGERLAPKQRGTGNTLRTRAFELRASLEEALGPNGVLILPVHPRPAPKHGEPMLRPFDWIATGLFNALENPATAVRTGFNAQGLPLGVQVVARRGLDHVSIAAAVAIEEAFGGFVLPS